jgi:hypothetical protein
VWALADGSSTRSHAKSMAGGTDGPGGSVLVLVDRLVSPLLVATVAETLAPWPRPSAIGHQVPRDDRAEGPRVLADR